MEYKTCSNPDHAEALPATTEYFYVDRKAKDGLTSRCRDCLKADQREYYQRHKEERLAYQRRYDQEHAEQISNWRESNSERLSHYRRDYYERHRARFLPQWREYSRGHRERIKHLSRG